MRDKKVFFDDWLQSQLKKPSLRKAYAEEDIRARLAVRIAELRREKKMSQAELAKRLSTTQQVISDIETFKNPNITLLTLQRIAQALQGRLVVEIQ